MSSGGLSYFTLDVNMEAKFELIEAEFGLTGFGVIVKILRDIYAGRGYYIEWTNEVALLFAKRNGLGGNVVSEIVSAAIRRGMFNEDLYDKYGILTSHGIQKRYFEAVKRRKEIEVDFRILLVNVAQICKNVDIKQKNVDISRENVDISEQSKGKESNTTTTARTREEEKAENAIPSLDEVEAYFKQNGIKGAADQFYAYNQKKNPDFLNWKVYASRWGSLEKEGNRAKRGNKRGLPIGFDLDEFFNAACRRGEST